MTGIIILGLYVFIFIAAFMVINQITKMFLSKTDFGSLKTVTFGDESAITPNRFASVISIVTLFMLWGAFTGSVISPVHMPGPFIGDTSFEYTAQNAQGQTASATVHLRVHKVDDSPEKIAIEQTSDTFAQDDSALIRAWRNGLIKVQRNDTGGKEDGYRVTQIDGQPITPGDGSVEVADGSVAMTPKGTLSFTPNKGLQMEPIWLPSPESVWNRLGEIATDGYRGFTLFEHLGWSLARVLIGFVLGALVGIPLGYAMGLSAWFRGWFDPIVEFMRPVPPLALIPLIIIWFGIGETGKIILLFLAALWIMIIAARSGVSGVNITKIHAAYSLGASKPQILRHVIIPNSLPEIFTGARVSMGVCWGTVVAAELVAAQVGAGQMIVAASKFQLTDIVIMGIILIGVIGFGIDVLMRMAEKWLVPWKGQS